MRPNPTSKPRWHYIVLALLVLGLIVQFITRPGTILIPLIVIGVVYYLYKRPPAWLQKFAQGNTYTPRYPKPQPPKQKKKSYRFRVINGKKKSM